MSTFDIIRALLALIIFIAFFLGAFWATVRLCKRKGILVDKSKATHVPSLSKQKQIIAIIALPLFLFLLFIAAFTVPPAQGGSEQNVAFILAILLIVIVFILGIGSSKNKKTKK